ncbi:MAG: 1-acyl-sn-glycerol-3-phosphate acyltransferase [Gemmatimonadota bacterium]|nr:1-acyl-sn-glycerol-3-phosphate acyltransferase [Gemmatimonadota bacterium]
MHALLRQAFFWLVVRPFLLIVTGMNVRHRERLPSDGPAIIIANHNSHLDTVVLMTLLPARLLKKTHPVGAADYFLANRLISWFALRIIGILPIDRSGRAPGTDPFADVSRALEEGAIVIIFPEGSRGEPEQLSTFKKGVAHLAKGHPDVPVVPVFMHGLGKSLPKDDWVPVPFFCDVFVGEHLFGSADHDAFMEALTERIRELAAEGRFPEWT